MTGFAVGDRVGVPWVGNTCGHCRYCLSAQMRELDVAGDTEIVETQGIAEDVASALMRCVQRRGADLVLMGTHGRRGLRRMVIGSVAERFVRYATCPVLLIRETADTERHTTD